MSDFIQSIFQSKVRGGLAVASMIWLFGVTIALFAIPIPTENKEIILSIVSFSTGVMLGGVFGFYFGDSQGGQRVSEN